MGSRFLRHGHRGSLADNGRTGRRRFSAKVDIGDFVLGGIEDSSRGNVVTPQFLMKAQNVKLPKSPLRPLL